MLQQGFVMTNNYAALHLGSTASYGELMWKACVSDFLCERLTTKPKLSKYIGVKKAMQGYS